MSADTLVQRLRDKQRGWHPDQVEAADRIEALEAEVERLALDAARLDWYDKNPSRIGFSYGYHGSKSNWTWRSNEGHIEDAPNLRTAIDAARSAAQKE